MRRKLIIGIFTILMLALVTGVAISAYVDNRFADVGNLSIEAKSDSNVGMSVDGINYSEDLTFKQISKAIVAKYQNFTLEENGNFKDSNGQEIEATDEVVSKYLEKIRFAAITSTNGKDFVKEDNAGNTTLITPQHGRYVSFDLYFRSQKDYEFSLYFNTKELQTDDLSQTTGIKSQAINLGDANLSANYTTFDSITGEVKECNNLTDIEVNPQDAMRFSTIVDDGANGEISKIYEPNIGLGSYATNLDSESYESLKNLASRYDLNKNAAYTYSKNMGQVYPKKEYSDMPKTHQGFETIESLTITSFTHKNEVKKVTFNIWLEGWDADCFEPIMSQRVSVSLAFTGTDVINKHTINYIDRGTTTQIDYLVSNLLPGVTPYLPYSSGNKFMGWYEDESYEIPFDFKKPVTSFNQVRTAYAKWA